MLLGIKSKKAVFLRHLAVATASGLLVFLVWRIHSSWSPDMRLWKAVGGASIILLWASLIIGPAARLWRPLTRFLSWRRELGVWFALISLLHGFLIWNGWARWDISGLLGYQFSSEAGMYLRAEPGFGLANLIGIVALTLGLALAATSFDRAVAFLGISSWKWVHTLSYAIFYLVVLHVLYFAFIHYTPSPTRMTNYPVNPLRYYYLAMLASISFVQSAAFVKTVWQKHANNGA